MDFVTTGKTKVRSVKCCVAFDPSDGAIRHVHRVVTLDGADETPEHALEETTLRLAKDVGLDTAKLQLLHVDPNSMQPGVRYVVDSRKRTLVAAERSGSDLAAGDVRTDGRRLKTDD